MNRKKNQQTNLQKTKNNHLFHNVVNARTHTITNTNTVNAFFDVKMSWNGLTLCCWSGDQCWSNGPPPLKMNTCFRLDMLFLFTMNSPHMANFNYINLFAGQFWGPLRPCSPKTKTEIVTSIIFCKYRIIINGCGGVDHTIELTDIYFISCFPCLLLLCLILTRAVGLKVNKENKENRPRLKPTIEISVNWKAFHLMESNYFVVLNALFKRILFLCKKRKSIISC